MAISWRALSVEGPPRGWRPRPRGIRSGRRQPRPRRSGAEDRRVRRAEPKSGGQLLAGSRPEPTPRVPARSPPGSSPVGCHQAGQGKSVESRRNRKRVSSTTPSPPAIQPRSSRCRESLVRSSLTAAGPTACGPLVPTPMPSCRGFTKRAIPTRTCSTRTRTRAMVLGPWFPMSPINWVQPLLTSRAARRMPTTTLTRKSGRICWPFSPDPAVLPNRPSRTSASANRASARGHVERWAASPIPRRGPYPGPGEGRRSPGQLRPGQCPQGPPQ